MRHFGPLSLPFLTHPLFWPSKNIGEILSWACTWSQTSGLGAAHSKLRLDRVLESKEGGQGGCLQNSKVQANFRWPYPQPGSWKEAEDGVGPSSGPSHIWRSSGRPSRKAQLAEPVSSGMFQARVAGKGTKKARETSAPEYGHLITDRAPWAWG